MTDKVYIRPIGFAPGPQSEEGDAIRLAGGLVYASRFAVILRRDGEVVERWRASRETIAQVLGQLPDSVAAEAETQWTNLRMAHPALAVRRRCMVSPSVSRDGSEARVTGPVWQANSRGAIASLA